MAKNDKKYQQEHNNEHHILGTNVHPLMIFNGGYNNELVKKVAKELKLDIGLQTGKIFHCGEKFSHQDESIRDADVFIFCQPRMGLLLDNDILECEKFVFSLKQGDPHRITVVMPYLPYARQDKKSLRMYREPKLVHFIPNQLKSAGADRMVVFKIHNPASVSNYPLLPMDNIDTDEMILSYIRNHPETFNLAKTKIAAPDLGASPYCKDYSCQLGIEFIIVNKERHHTKISETTVTAVHGEAKGYDIIYIDDMADTCGTIKSAAMAVKAKGANKQYFFAVHPVLSDKKNGSKITEKAIDNLNKAKFDGVFFTDTVELSSAQKNAINNLTIISVSTLLGRVIENIHNGKSVSGLWNGNS